MLPLHTAVRISNSEDDLDGQVAFVLIQPGDETTESFVVPDGWYQVALDPWNNGFTTELYREENLEICGC